MSEAYAASRKLFGVGRSIVRQRATFVSLLAAVILLAGCARPAGVDGNLTNGWPMPAEPKLPMPAAPACYNVPGEDPESVGKWPAPVDCGTEHTVETAFIGQFTGADAQRTSPPSSGGPERRAAYQECATQAKAYLGDDWRVGRLELFLVLPIELHWEAGARWYRCDLVEYKDLEDFKIVTRAASLKGGLAAGGELRLACTSVTAAGDAIDKVLPAACNATHNGEFAGVFDHADGPYPTDQAARSKANLEGCRGVVATFAAIPNDSNFQYRTGQVASPFSKAAWELGNRGVRCFIWTPKNVSNSLKGAGPGGLPINYA